MFDAAPCPAGSAPIEASIAVERRAPRPSREAGMTRPQVETSAHAQSADRAASGVVRLAVAGAIAANASFPLIELWRITAAGEVPNVRLVMLATAATLALHLRHVVLGLRHERHRFAEWTLAALVVVNVAAAILIGRNWALQFASLAVS